MVRKKTIILFVLLLAILFCSYVEYDYQKYLKNKPVDSSFVEVVEGLSINYASGKKIEVSDQHLEYDFSVTNLGNEEKNYVVEIKNLSGDKQGVFYEIVETTSMAKETGELAEKELLSASVLAGATKRYHLAIENPQKKELSFTLDTVYQSVDDRFKTVILANHTVNDDVVEDGLIKKSEQNGFTYYFRGKVEDNYVSFANFLWRIVRINEDQSVKLILNDTLDNMAKFYEEPDLGHTFDTSNIQLLLEDFYNLNLKDYDSYIASTMYCYDDSVLTEEELKVEYLPSYRLFVDKLPTYSCSGTSLPLKISLLTADEAVFAGASFEEANTYYLNGEYQSSWWTMTPSKMENNVMYFMAITKDGVLQKDVAENTSLFFRPVISLNRRVKVEGRGTLEEPYTVIAEE